MLQEFLPAGSISEAASRMFALSGQPPHSGRGPKRALVALARSLAQDVDMEATNAVLGSEIADALGAAWPASAATRTNQITLDGMNALLRGAVLAFRHGSLVEMRSVMPPTLTDWQLFQPARSKIEAVNRISALTHSGPQGLGPGGKERKSVLVNLAQAVFPEVDTTLSKTKLGAALAEELGVPWTDSCSSTGYTITLDGLNTILAGAERYLDVLGAGAGSAFATPEEEGAALAAALRDGLPAHWDGRRCVAEMRDGEYSHWRQSEWPGWYYEYVGLPTLNDAFAMSETSGPQRRFGQTVFDYALGRVWDLKAHTERKVYEPSGSTERAGASMILNDAEATRACVEVQGLGFFVLGGDAYFDDDESFDAWHREFTAGSSAERTRSNTGRRRRRKASFTPRRCDAYWIENLPALDAVIAAGHFRVQPQGRQQLREGQVEGAARRDKLHMHTSKAHDLVIASIAWP